MGESALASSERLPHSGGVNCYQALAIGRRGWQVSAPPRRVPIDPKPDSRGSNSSLIR